MGPQLEGKDSRITGVKVMDRRHAIVGKVEDVAIHDRIAYLVLAFDATQDAPGKLSAVRWNVVHFDRDKQVFILNLTPDEIDRLPAFDAGSFFHGTNDNQNPQIEYRDIPPF